MKRLPISIQESIAVEHLLVIHDAEADAKDIEAAIDWIERSPANRDLYDHMNRFWLLCDRVAADEHDEIVKSKPLRLFDLQSMYVPALRRVASLIAPLLIMAGLVYGTLIYTAPVSDPTRPRLDQQYVTGVGEIRTISLADGTRVSMGGATALGVRIARNKRYVTLTGGNAYFEVAHDRSRPFVVKAIGGTTEALGTAFEVRKERAEVAVTLVRGSVRIQVDGGLRSSGLRLQPGQEVSYFPDGRIGEPRHVDPSEAIAWRTGRLHFSGRSLNSVAEELNRYSRKRIVIEDSSAGDISITGVVRLGEISPWLRGLASISDVTVAENPDAIVIRSR